MGTDVIAVLRIRNLPPPKTRFSTLSVVHRGDASLVSTGARYGGDPAEVALYLRRLLGATLDQHDDPRGILLLPDSLDVVGNDYDAIVDRRGADGVWAPLLGENDTLPRYAHAAPGSHDALVARLIEALGHDEATTFDLVARVNLRLCETHPERREVAAELDRQMATLTERLGADFAATYRASLRRAVAADVAEEEERARERDEFAKNFRPIDLSDALDGVSQDAPDSGLELGAELKAAADKLRADAEADPELAAQLRELAAILKQK